MNCKTCQASLIGDYCHVCGQKVIGRFSFKSVVDWIKDDIFVFDKGFAFTIKELLVRPVRLINDYIAGSTNKYFNPYKLLFIVTTIPFVIISMQPGFKSFPGNLELLRDWPEVFSRSSFNYFMEKSAFFLVSNFLAYFLLTIPIWTLFSRFLFKSRGLNYVENIIYVSYLSSGYILLMFCLGPLIYLAQVLAGSNVILFLLLSIPFGLVLFGYVIKSAKEFYEESYFKVILKGAFMGYLGVIVSMLFQFCVLSFWRLLI